MPKLKTRFIKYSERGFKNKFDNLIYGERKSNNKINLNVSNIIKKIRENGDEGLNYFVRKFDKINVNQINELFISKNTLKNAYDGLKKEQKKALNIAAERIKEFHKKQVPQNINYRDNIKVKLGLMYSPIESTGFYVPGGTNLSIISFNECYTCFSCWS